MKFLLLVILFLYFIVDIMDKDEGMRRLMEVDIMDNDEDMRRLMEPLLSYLLRHVGITTVTSDSFSPIGCQTKDFFQTVKTAMMLKRQDILTRWQNFFETKCLKALSSHEMYLRYVLFTCDMEIIHSNNIFDGILGVFALVVSYNIDTLINSFVNFCELSVDIFMAIYKSTLKQFFFMEGGFEGFNEYLRTQQGFIDLYGHNHNDPEVSSVQITKKYSLKNVLFKPEKVIGPMPKNPSRIEHRDILKNTKCKSLAKEVLSTTKIKLPPLKNVTDLKAILEKTRQRKAAASLTVTNYEAVISAAKSENNAPVSKSENKTLASKLENKENKAPASKSENKTPASKSENKAPAWKSENKASASKSVNKESASKSLNKESFQKVKEATFKHITSLRDSKPKLSDPDWKKNSNETTAKRKNTKVLSKEETEYTASHLIENLKKCHIETDSLNDQKVKLNWCEDIILQVVKYNTSKSSKLKDVDKQILRDANEILRQLEDKMKELADLLKDCEA